MAKAISGLTSELLASAVTDTDEIMLAVDNTGDSTTYKMSLSELRKTTVADVTAYGAKGDGVTDDTAAILAAATASREVYLPEGDYLIEDLSITANQDLHLFGPGRLLVAANTNGLDIELPLGALITPTSITSEDSSTQANSTKVTEVNAVSHGLVVGDVVKVVSNATYSDLSSVTAVVGEIAVVETVPSGDVFRLHKELEDIGTGDAGIVIRKIPAAKIKLDIHVELVGAQAVQSGVPTCVRVANAINPVIKVDCDKSHETILTIENCFGGKAEVTANWASDDEANGVFGYGVRIGGGTVGFKASISCGPLRHACTSKDANGVAYGTTAALMTEFGRSKDVTIHDSLAIGCHSSAFDTHANSSRWTFSGCKAIFPGIIDETSGYLPVGFQVRGRDCSFVGCETVGGRNGFSDVSAGEHSGTWRTDYIGCRAIGARLRGLHVDSGQGASDKHYVNVNGGLYEARSAGMTIEDSNTDISNCEIRYTGFTHPVTLAQTTAPLNVRFNNVRFNHTTDNDEASVSLTSGTADVQVTDCFSELFATLGTDGLFEAASGTTATINHHNWRWSSGKNHQGMTSGLGTINYASSGTATDADATPSVSGLTVLTTANTAPTTITGLDDGYAGQIVVVIIGDGNTTIDFTGTTLKGNSGADWTPASGDHMTCVYNGTNWYCQVSDNTA